MIRCSQKPVLPIFVWAQKCQPWLTIGHQGLRYTQLGKSCVLRFRTTMRCDQESSLPSPAGYMKGYKRQVTEVIGAPPAKVARSATSESAREPRTTTPASETLPAPWTKVWNDEHDQFYFWNTMTKQSSWNRPTMGPNNATGLYTEALHQTFGFSSETETISGETGKRTGSAKGKKNKDGKNNGKGKQEREGKKGKGKESHSDMGRLHGAQNNDWEETNSTKSN